MYQEYVLSEGAVILLSFDKKRDDLPWLHLSCASKKSSDEWEDF